MRLREIHTVPVWEDPDGSRRLGIAPEKDHPPVVGWANVAVIDIEGEPHEFVLTLDAC